MKFGINKYFIKIVIDYIEMFMITLTNIAMKLT